MFLGFKECFSVAVLSCGSRLMCCCCACACYVCTRYMLAVRQHFQDLIKNSVLQRY